MNYEDNATRKTGAISELLFSSFAMSTDNTVARSKFINAKPVYFPPVEGNNRWSNDDYGNSSYPNTVFHDQDGTITGVPDSYIVNNMSGADLIENCEVRPTWNAAVCTGDIGRMNIGGGGITSAGGARQTTFAIAPGGAASEAHWHLQGPRWLLAMARRSSPTAKPTFARAANSRSRQKAIR